MPAEVGDVFRYSNGNEYAITDGGPVVMSRCAVCGSPAGTTFDYKVSDVRCGRCLSDQYELLAGQRIDLLKSQYAREHPTARRLPKG
jgi:Zn finger protein HypA/HybF involved in hydrogenase expression